MKKSREAGMLISVLVLAAVLAVGSGLPVMAGEKESVETETVSEEENTVSRINAQIVSITGNQMTYIRLDEAEQNHESEEENKPERVREAITEASPEEGGMPDFTGSGMEESRGQAAEGSEQTSEGKAVGRQTPPTASDTAPERNRQTNPSAVGERDTGGSGNESGGQNTGRSGSGSDEQRTEAGTMPEGTDPGNVPEGMSAGSMPEGMSMGNMPEGMGPGTIPERMGTGNMPEGMDPGDMQSGTGSGERSRQGASSGTSAGAEVTVYIPVSAPVYTDTGKQKTFSVLRSGDTITIESEQNSMDEEIITAIYLTGTQE